VLGLAAPELVEPLADLGLGFVFLLAGYELDQRLYRQDAGRRALLAWTVSLVLALGVVGLLTSLGLVRAFVPVALAMTTTALGTLVPILRENDMLRGRLGTYLMAGGAAGELLPILAIAVFLGIDNRFVALLSLAAVVVLAMLLAVSSRVMRPGGRLVAVFTERQHETSQITLRFTVLLLVLLLAVTERFHLDAVLGAFVAGMVLRRWAGPSAPVLEEKLDVAGHGFLIPIFFVYSGMTIDLHSIAQAPLRLVLFFVLVVAIRGLPAMLVYLGVLSLRERIQTGLVSATALPLVVALAEIGLRNGTMLPENAAALVGAAVLTVLVFPTVAAAIHRPAVPDHPAATSRPRDDERA
jgi:Kef-type K+ transport system membrane component KefB